MAPVRPSALSLPVSFQPSSIASELVPPVAEPVVSDRDSYLLVRSTEPLAAGECEDVGALAIEVVVLWGTSVLEVLHLAPERAFYVGPGEGADFVLPAELPGFDRAPIVELGPTGPRVVVPPGGVLARRDGGAPGDELELTAGRSIDLQIGAITFRIAAVSAGARVPRAVAEDSGRIGAALACSVGAVAAFMGVLAYYTPALGASLDDELDRDQVLLLRPYLDSLAEREERRPETPGDAAPGGGNPGAEAAGPRGAMGRPNRPVAGKRVAIAGTGERELPREQALVEARTFGLVGMLTSMNGRALPTALWGASVANGPDAIDAWGNMFGESIGESGGAGGLDLSGTGSGGGERGTWIGLGGIGTCGTDCGVGTGAEGLGPGRYGRGIGRNGPGHRTAGPTLRAAGETVVGGHLAPELIQRVVRQNFGRFRGCYELGLRGNPNLTGRITTRFIIDREGAVSNATNGGSDLPDSKVVGCVVSAFYGVSFPAPKDGIVRVSYPIMFNPG